MRLSEIMSGLDLSIYPQIALIIFLVVFVFVMKRAFSRSNRGEFARAAALPLDDASSGEENQTQGGRLS